MEDGKSLSAEQIAGYWENGYIVIPGVLSAEEIETYKARARAVAHGEYPPEAKSRIMRDVRIAKGVVPAPEDPEDGLWKLMNPDRFDQTFRDFTYTPKLLDPVEDLLGPDLIAFLMMMIYKPPMVADAVHPFHQDAFYFPFGPHEKVLGCWIPLDDADESNGTLVVVPGSHKNGVAAHEYPDGLVNMGSFHIPGADEAEGAKVLEVKAGDAVLFNSRTWHKSLGNRSERRRRVITMHAASAECAPTRDADIGEFGMRLVRGELHEGGIQPPAEASLAFRTHSASSFENDVSLPQR